MPKIMNFQRGAVIYFEETVSNRIFILQGGQVIISGHDVETGKPELESVQSGAFFGVKDTLAHTLRGETATAVADSVVLCLTASEFEATFGSNRDIMYKMLRLFSKKLRTMNFRIEKILKKARLASRMNEMVTVAESFYEERKWRTCAELCSRYRALGATGGVLARLERMEKDARGNLESLSGDASDFLEDVEIFQNFGESAKKRFELPGFSRFEKKYNRGDVVIAEFEPGNSFYILQSGVVQLTKCVNGSNINLNFLCPGDIFGEMAILDASPRSASCIAMTTIEVLEFNKQNFSTLIGGNAQITVLLLRIFCRRLIEQTRRLRVLVQPEDGAKIADLFLMLEERNPSELIAGGNRLFSLSEADVSRWTGLSLQTTHDELRKLSERGVASLADGRITVNIKEMQRIVKNAELAEKMRKRVQ